MAVPSLLDMEKACRKQQASKAPGPDCIINEVWKLFPAYAGEWTWLLCAQIALSGHEPARFKLALICALYKKGPAALPANYRSIALMNGLAKLWHGHLRGSIGNTVLQGYDCFQLGGRRGIPISFAVAAYRSACELSIHAGRSVATLFVDIQAAYYEASRQLVFEGGDLADSQESLPVAHLQRLASELLSSGALALLGVPIEERLLPQDCVECSHWRLVTSQRVFLAGRGTRPGDGLADVLFGALFSVALQHIRRTCRLEGIGHSAAGIALARPGDILQLGWADDLAIVSDFDTPADLQRDFPRLAGIVISTLQALRFKVNLGSGKTEALLDIRGPHAKKVRGDMLLEGSQLTVVPGVYLRIAPEYRYLGVIQTPKDTGRRDTELCSQRACGAWAHGRKLLTSQCTSLAVSARAWSPLTGFFERAARTLIGSWTYGHVLTRATLLAILGLPEPQDAATVARVRLVVQLVTRAPKAVFELFDAAWNRALPWCEILADSVRQVSEALPAGSYTAASISHVRQHASALLKPCRRLSRWGTLQRAVWLLWDDVVQPRAKLIVGTPLACSCPLCHLHLPSAHALAAHLHRRHTIVNTLTRFTQGTVCLWCHCEHHTTDRHKYHLRVSPACVHGLRVTVGEAYVYGSGTKRSGQRAHRGLPSYRLPGPVNATPAQRQAAAENRTCSAEDLAAELQAVTGATDVFQWPTDIRSVGRVSLATLLPDNSMEPVPAPISAPAHTGLLASSSAQPPGRWFTLIDPSLVSDTDVCTPSGYWSGLLSGSFACQFPASWHRYWKLWQAMHTLGPWDTRSFSAAAVLRRAAPASHDLDSKGCAATVGLFCRQQLPCEPSATLWSIAASSGCVGFRVELAFCSSAPYFHRPTFTFCTFLHPRCL